MSDRATSQRIAFPQLSIAMSFLLHFRFRKIESGTKGSQNSGNEFTGKNRASPSIQDQQTAFPRDYVPAFVQIVFVSRKPLIRCQSEKARTSKESDQFGYS
jgi:hypothetical protein